MKEIYTTSDAGEKAFLKSLFEDIGIPVFFFDENLSNMLGGWGDGFAPCRIMVSDSDFDAACDIIDEYLDHIEAEDDDEGEEEDDDHQA